MIDDASGAFHRPACSRPGSALGACALTLFLCLAALSSAPRDSGVCAMPASVTGPGTASAACQAAARLARASEDADGHAPRHDLRQDLTQLAFSRKG